MNVREFIAPSFRVCAGPTWAATAVTIGVAAPATQAITARTIRRMADHVATCACGTCGNTLTAERFDIRCGLPDAVLTVPAAQRARLLTEVFDRDDVLERNSFAMPVTIRQRFTDHWSAERTAGFGASVVDGNQRFVGPDRTVVIDVHNFRATQPPEEVLADRLTGAPVGPVTFREDTAEEVRFAFAVTAAVTAQDAQHELYGYVIRPDSIVQITCIHDDPAHLDWAADVWRSVRFHP